MEANIQELYTHLKKLSTIIELLKEITVRTKKLYGSESYFWDELLVYLEQCNTSKKRISTLETKIPTIKNQISKWLENKKTNFITSLKLNQEFDIIVNNYKALECGITTEKKYLNGFRQDVLIRIREIGLIEVECEQDLITVVLWKDLLDNIKTN